MSPQDNSQNYGRADSSNDQKNAPAYAWEDDNLENENLPRTYRTRTPAHTQNYGGEASYEANTPSGAGAGSVYDQALTPQPQGWQRRKEGHDEMMALPPEAEEGNSRWQASGSCNRYDNTYQQSSEQRSQADAPAFAIPNTAGPQSQLSQSSTPRAYAIQGTPDGNLHRQAPIFLPWPHYPGRWDPDER